MVPTSYSLYYIGNCIGNYIGNLLKRSWVGDGIVFEGLENEIMTVVVCR